MNNGGAGPAPIRVVYAADDNYALPLAVSLRSLVEHADDVGALAVTVLTTRFSDEAADLVRGSCPEIVPDFVTVPSSAVAGLPLIEYWTPTIYLRLLMPSLVPGPGPLISIDADTLVLADLTELRDTPLTGRPLAAVNDPARPRFSTRGDAGHWAGLGIAGDSPYFCAGTMLIDPAAWRAHDVTERTMAYVRRHHDRLETPEQEALNVVLHGNWLPLDPAWAVWTMVAGAAVVARRLGVEYTLSEEQSLALAHPRIVHFAGKDKPWFAEAMHGPYGNLFYEYVDRTAWRGWRPDRRQSGG